MRVISLASILLLVPSIHAAEARIPKTTVLTLTLDQELEGKKVKKGKEFKAHLSEPVTGAGGQVIIPAGSELKGRIEDADERHLTLKFKEIETPSGKKSIEARLVGVDAENVKVEENELESPGKSGKKKVAAVGTTATGMATGGIAGSAVKGLGRIFFGGGGEGLKLKKGTLLRIELRKELKLKLKEGQVSYWQAPPNARGFYTDVGVHPEAGNHRAPGALEGIQTVSVDLISLTHDTAAGIGTDRKSFYGRSWPAERCFRHQLLLGSI